MRPKHISFSGHTVAKGGCKSRPFATAKQRIY